MATDRRHRSRTAQPELPLPGADSGARSGRSVDRSTADWRLDEDTRRIGLLGIAAARAHLAPDPAGAGRAGSRADQPRDRAA